MMGIGIIVSYLGYAVLYWAIEAFQGNSQDSFTSYLFPFVAKNPSVQGIGGSTGGGASAPADTKAANKNIPTVGTPPQAVTGTGTQNQTPTRTVRGFNVTP